MYTNTKDITGRTIQVGDICVSDFKGDDTNPFKVVFERDEFRKEYLSGWGESIPKPILEYGAEAKAMRLKIYKTLKIN